MNVTDIGQSDWAGTLGFSSAVELSDFSEADENLATVFCGAGGSLDSCDFDDGIFGAYVTSPKICVVGFSDGAGFGKYLNYKYDHRFVKVVALDNWAFSNYGVWLAQGYNPIDPPKVKATIY